MFFWGFQQCDLICHSLAIADPDVCGGGGPDLPEKSQVFLVYIGKKLLDPPPPPGLYFSWTPWNLVWPESPRDFSKAWTSQQTLPGNWLNSLLYSITLWTNPRGGGVLWWGPQGSEKLIFLGCEYFVDIFMASSQKWTSFRGLFYVFQGLQVFR